MNKHPNLSDDINANIARSEKDGGVWLRDLRDGDVVRIQTRNTLYTLRKVGGELTIEGNARYCPHPTPARLHGSTWGGSMLKVGFIGVGMCLEFSTYADGARPITTSTIASVEVNCADATQSRAS